jgi:hypothetical protein
MKPGLSIPIDKTKEVLAAIRLLSKQEVLIGIPENADSRSDQIGNAQLGYIHEHGSPSANIPDRPFLRPGVAAVQDKIAEELTAGAKAMLTGNFKAPLTAMNRVGIIASSSVKAKINNMGEYPADSPTLKARQRKGYKGKRILIRTGALRNSITYVIRDKK